MIFKCNNLEEKMDQCCPYICSALIFFFYCILAPKKKAIHRFTNLHPRTFSSYDHMKQLYLQQGGQWYMMQCLPILTCNPRLLCCHSVLRSCIIYMHTPVKSTSRMFFGLFPHPSHYLSVSACHTCYKLVMTQAF